MARRLALLYGVACYVLFLVTFLWAIGFVTGLYGPTALDAPPATAPLRALLASSGRGRGWYRGRSSAARSCSSRAWPCC